MVITKCVAIATKQTVISKDADKIRSITQTIVAPNNNSI